MIVVARFSIGSTGRADAPMLVLIERLSLVPVEKKPQAVLGDDAVDRKPRSFRRYAVPVFRSYAKSAVKSSQSVAA